MSLVEIRENKARREAFAFSLYERGVSFADIGRRLDVSYERARQMVRGHELTVGDRAAMDRLNRR